jgi:hypothetical protein
LPKKAVTPKNGCFEQNILKHHIQTGRIPEIIRLLASKNQKKLERMFCGNISNSWPVNTWDLGLDSHSYVLCHPAGHRLVGD